MTTSNKIYDLELKESKNCAACDKSTRRGYMVATDREVAESLAGVMGPVCLQCLPDFLNNHFQLQSSGSPQP